ncbi:MAG TPA: hypothetical protein VN408_01115 [Actinoplanes sp.]|nr:hypothetical protein [Actinoplanes sp.]
MDDEESIRRFGLRPDGAELDEVRAILREQARLGQDEQDTELMRLCCVQLFNAGLVDDVLDIWRAKESSWDAQCALDIQLLCGAGLAETKRHLAADGSADAADALSYLAECEVAGDFAGFSVAEQARGWARYYRVTDG